MQEIFEKRRVKTRARWGDGKDVSSERSMKQRDLIDLLDLEDIATGFHPESDRAQKS